MGFNSDTSMKIRLDAELVRRELARSRENACELIESRSVLVNGIPQNKHWFNYRVLGIEKQ